MSSADGTVVSVAKFEFTPATDGWWWSEPMYNLYGFVPGEVVPTTELVTSHHHPEDRDQVQAHLAKCVRDGAAFSTQHRIITASGQECWVALVGEGIRAEDGSVRSVRGYAVNLTDEQQRTIAELVDVELDQALKAHAVVDQAKGALMLVYGMDELSAFQLLRWYSQRTNTKLRTLAERIVAATTSGLTVSASARATLDDVLYGLSTVGPDGEGATETAPWSEPAAAPVPLQTRLDESRGTRVLRVEGDIDLASGPQFNEALRGLTRDAAEGATVVVDLTKVEHLGQAGLDVLQSWRNRSRQAGIDVRVVLEDAVTVGIARKRGFYSDVASALAP